MVVPVADTKPYVEPDPVIGYRYIPNTRMTLPRPGGGKYEMVVNSQGIRSDREYPLAKVPGSVRIIVLGDSMAAGQFVSNAQRFSELMERRHPRFEVINLALEGSGTDQQVLLYEHVGLRFEHDVVVILPFLQNIRRNLASVREAIHPSSGTTVFRPKPRFELIDGELVLRPVGADVSAPLIDEPQTALLSMKAAVSRMPGANLLKRAAYALKPWEPFPEYADPASPGWLLMAALLRRLKRLAGTRPVGVAPVVYSNYVRYRMATNYWDRFASLADDGLVPIDLLPHFRRLGEDAVRCFQDPHDMHLSADGHLVLAEALEAELHANAMVPRA